MIVYGTTCKRECVLSTFLVHSTVHHWNLKGNRASPRSATLSLLCHEYCPCLRSCQVHWALHFHSLFTESVSKTEWKQWVMCGAKVMFFHKVTVTVWFLHPLCYLVSFVRTVVCDYLYCDVMFLFRVSADNMIIELCLIAFCEFCIHFYSFKLNCHLGL